MTFLKLENDRKKINHNIKILYNKEPKPIKVDELTPNEPIKVEKIHIFIHISNSQKKKLFKLKRNIKESERE
jgi:hypothetical protein